MFYKHLHDPSCALSVHGDEAPQSKEAQLQAALDQERTRREASEQRVAELEAILAGGINAGFYGRALDTL